MQDEKEIIKKLEKINKIKIFNLETVFYIISLPLIDKNSIMATFTNLIQDKMEEYVRETE